MKDWEKKVRTWAWERLVFLADRISPEDAFRATGLYMHLKKGEGWVLDDDKGFQIWYKGTREYNEHSHDGYDEAPVITDAVFNVGGFVLSKDTTQGEVEKHLLSSLHWEMRR